MTATPLAYSYIRISTVEQRLGHGLQRQIERSREYAKKHGLMLVEDDPLHDIGVSAFRGANVAEGKLGAFLAAVKANKIPRGSYLLVESLDRVSRQEVHKSLRIFLDIIDAGINIVTLMDERVYNAEKRDPMDIMFSIIFMMRANEESEAKRDRISRVWANKRVNAKSRPITSICPAWLKPTRDKKLPFEIIEERAAIVRSIFEDSARGIGNYVIVKRLNENRVQPFGSRKKQGNGGWHTGSINRIPSSRATIGEFQPHRKPVNNERIPDGDSIKDYFPRIIDDELFYRAQQARRQRLTHELHKGRGGRKGQNYSNLFSGIASCVYCKFPMYFENKGSLGSKTYLVCSRAKHGSGCIKTRWSYSDFEASFLEFVEELDLASIVNVEEHEQARLKLAHEIDSYRGKIASLEREMDEKFNLPTKTATARDYVANKLDKLGQQLTELNTAIKRKEQQLTSLKIQPMNIEELKPIISQVQGNGKDAYQLRAQIAARLKSLVDAIFVAVVGSGPLLEKAKHDPGEAEGEGDIAKIAPTDPRMHGRWFSVKFSNQNKFLLVAPDAENPRKFTKIGVVAPLMIGETCAYT
jgi:DNA invertase Pin-like site-specific DNA recombinase